MLGDRKGTDMKITTKKRRLHKFGRSNLKQSRMGVTSCIYAGCSFGVLAVAVIIAFVMHGESGGFLGGLAIFSIVLAAFGLQAAFKGLREREKNYLTCKIGIAANIVMLLLLVVIFIGGLM